MANAGPGKIRLFEDFLGAELIIAHAATVGFISGGDFKVIGDGVAINDSGITILDADGLSGVGVLNTTNEDKKGIHLATTKMFDVTLMAPLVAECRVRFVDLDTKQFFMGFSDQNGDDLSLEDDLISNDAANTLTLTSSNLVGFLYDEALTDDEDWHMVYNGGTTTGETDSRNIDANSDQVAGEWKVLRVEVDPNGTARWYVNGAIKQTKAGAVSLTADLAATCGVEAKDATLELAHLDYFLVTANRDWTR
ncbi:hypothetical protein LCGC14_1986730 [marine sediment metagenome]|uniref:Uncharacterized protein n=1 Tax=marine sediment metagenome TaxID=412755 RepID=A0A0F9FVA0_9ZZZZ